MLHVPLPISARAAEASLHQEPALATRWSGLRAPARARTPTSSWRMPARRRRQPVPAVPGRCCIPMMLLTTAQSRSWERPAALLQPDLIGFQQIAIELPQLSLAARILQRPLQSALPIARLGQRAAKLRLIRVGGVQPRLRVMPSKLFGVMQALQSSEQ